MRRCQRVCTSQSQERTGPNCPIGSGPHPWRLLCPLPVRSRPIWSPAIIEDFIHCYFFLFLPSAKINILCFQKIRPDIWGLLSLRIDSVQKNEYFLCERFSVEAAEMVCQSFVLCHTVRWRGVTLTSLCINAEWVCQSGVIKILLLSLPRTLTLHRVNAKKHSIFSSQCGERFNLQYSVVNVSSNIWPTLQTEFWKCSE